MNVTEEFVTPKLAEAYLESNDGNRSLSPGRVRAYAEAMKRGEWKQNGDVIRIAESGRLLDGQHRLAAICRSGVSQRFFVVRGLPDHVFDTIDTGAARGASDILSIRGIKNSTATAASIRLFLTWRETGNPVFGTPEKKPTNTNILEFAERNPQLVQRAGEVAVASSFNKKVISSAIIGFIYLAADHAGIDHDQVDRFFAEIADPSISGGKGAAFLLRDRMMQDMASKSKMRKYEKIALVMKAFRLWRSGAAVRIIRLQTEGEKAEKDIFRMV